MLIRASILLLTAALPVWAQSNQPAASAARSQANFSGQQIEKVRADCIEHRRIICGKIVKILPEGIVVDSGYDQLLRPSLKQSWLMPGTVEAGSPAPRVEGREPDALCAGLVFLADFPKKPAVQLYDYVDLRAYPEGEFTYASVGDVKHTVRKFSARLKKAAQWQLNEMARRN